MEGCIQPMSSPMMKRMLGFACCCCCCCGCCCCAGRGGGCCCCRCCAAAGMLAVVMAAIDASRPRQTGLLMLCSSRLGCPDGAGSLGQIARLDYGWKPAETMQALKAPNVGCPDLLRPEIDGEPD